MSIFLPYPPPPYKRKIWEYKSANSTNIRNELGNINWHELFTNLNVSEMTLLFTDLFLNVMSKHITNKVVTFNDKDAPWITPQVKTAILRNSRVYKKCVAKGRNPLHHEQVRKIQNDTNKLIKAAKLSYYSHLGCKLSDPSTGQKQFWTAYKTLANTQTSES